jgi:hypothetical protein
MRGLVKWRVFVLLICTRSLQDVAICTVGNVLFVVVVEG